MQLNGLLIHLFISISVYAWMCECYNSTTFDLPDSINTPTFHPQQQLLFILFTFKCLFKSLHLHIPLHVSQEFLLYMKCLKSLAFLLHLKIELLSCLSQHSMLFIYYVEMQHIKQRCDWKINLMWTAGEVFINEALNWFHLCKRNKLSNYLKNKHLFFRCTELKEMWIRIVKESILMHIKQFNNYLFPFPLLFAFKNTWTGLW